VEVVLVLQHLLEVAGTGGGGGGGMELQVEQELTETAILEVELVAVVVLVLLQQVAGGSGVVILRMPDASYSGTTTGSPTVTTGVDGTDTVLVFTASGSYTA
jgi:hypothetical protein